MNNNGVVTAYDARTGRQAFRGRVGVGGTFSASPVAADGRLYVASEEGEVYIVTVGPGLSPDCEKRHEGSDHGDSGHLRRDMVVRTIGHM